MSTENMYSKKVGKMEEETKEIEVYIVESKRGCSLVRVDADQPWLILPLERQASV